MSKLRTGPVFEVGAPMTDAERAESRAELEELETDLIRRRKRLAYWAFRKAQAEADPSLPADLRESAHHFYGRALRLVQSGEKLRALILAELYSQPEHLPSYHHSH